MSWRSAPGRSPGPTRHADARSSGRGDPLGPALDAVRGQVERGEVPVAILGVARRDRIVAIEAFGPRARPDSVVLIASITKPIVATAVMQLVEAGRLSLRTPIHHYLPEFEPLPPGPNLPGRELVTAWHLLTHTSGIVDPDGPPETPMTRAELLGYALRAPLRFVPGTRFEYASVTFYLLGELIRRLGGLDYPEYLAERIFRPLSMTDTTFVPAAIEPPERLLPVHFLGAPVDLQDEIARWFVGTAMPGGGLWSTAADLLTFGRAILAGGTLGGVRIVGRRSVELMTREQTAGIREEGVPPRDPGYGLGWALAGLDGRLPVSRSAFGHGGATGTRLLVDPEADLVVVYLTTVWGADERHALEAVGAVAAALAD